MSALVRQTVITLIVATTALAAMMGSAVADAPPEVHPDETVAAEPTHGVNPDNLV